MAIANPWRRFVDRVGGVFATGWLKLAFAFGIGLYLRVPAICIVAGGAAVVIYCLQRARRYKETTYTPISVDELPWRARKFFEEHTLAFEECGFTMLGDFLVEKTTGKSHVRGFIHDVLPILAEISHNRKLVPATCYYLTTVVEDGTVIQTSRRSLAGIPQMEKIHLISAKNQPPHVLLDEHLAAIRDYEDDDLAMLPLEASDLRNVSRYGSRLVQWHFYAKGALGRPPSFDESRFARSTENTDASPELAEQCA